MPRRARDNNFFSADLADVALVGRLAVKWLRLFLHRPSLRQTTKALGFFLNVHPRSREASSPCYQRTKQCRGSAARGRKNCGGCPVSFFCTIVSLCLEKERKWMLRKKPQGARKTKKSGKALLVAWGGIEFRRGARSQRSARPSRPPSRAPAPRSQMNTPIGIRQQLLKKQNYASDFFAISSAISTTRWL